MLVGSSVSEVSSRFYQERSLVIPGVSGLGFTVLCEGFKVASSLLCIEVKGLAQGRDRCKVMLRPRKESYVVSFLSVYIRFIGSTYWVPSYSM
jgi:hypothetical protein